MVCIINSNTVGLAMSNVSLIHDRIPPGMKVNIRNLFGYLCNRFDIDICFVGSTQGFFFLFWKKKKIQDEMTVIQVMF